MNSTHTKCTEAEKNNDKDGKAFYKWMNNAIYAKIMKTLKTEWMYN